MKNESPKKLEIFLLLALRRTERSASVSDNLEDDDLPEDFLSVFAGRLPETEAVDFDRLRADYLNKSEAEKEEWRGQIENFIGADEPLLDEHIHFSNIDAALLKETRAIRKIVVGTIAGNKSNAKQSQRENAKSRRNTLEKAVRRTFAKQFVGQSDLPRVSSFDRLNGARLARLIRLAGIREVAFACVRIKAVELIAAFMRRFSAEDARAIAAQMNGLPKISPERLLFAENFVQTALETESKPSAMLDLLGLRLVGIMLCGDAPERTVYTEQKLPLEAASKLSEIINAQSRRASGETERQIGREIEQLAETILKAIDKS